MPSDHQRRTFLLPTRPQLLNQVPPGAQQLTLPDFWNVPHFGHVNVLAVVEVTDGVLLTEVLIGVLAMSSRSGIDQRIGYWRVPCVMDGVYTVRDIDPVVPPNMPTLLA